MKQSVHIVYQLLLAISILLLGTAVFVLSTAQTAAQSTQPQTATVRAVAETDPMPHNGDAADDPAIWIHPSDPSLSTVIGTDKNGGLAVYGLDGKQLQYLSIGKINNVDLRYNVLLGGEQATLVIGGNQSSNSFVVYKVNPTTRLLENVAARMIKIGFSPYGTCMYHSPKTGAYYVFVTRSPYPLNNPDTNSGEIRQFELFESGGKIDMRQVRSFKVGSDTEGCVADDVSGDLYVSQTKVGIWKYAAEPDADTTRTSVAKIGDGYLKGELEGISIYYSGERTGYIIVSQQCCAEFVVFRREAPHEYVMTFRISGTAGTNIDNVSGTDGIDVTNVALRGAFPQGLFVAHDTRNDPGGSSYTNFKLVPWEGIAQAGSPALTISTSWDPRAVGAGPVPTPTLCGAQGCPTATSTPTSTATSTATATATPISTPTATSTGTTTATPTSTAEATPPATNTPDQKLNTFNVWLPFLNSP